MNKCKKRNETGLVGYIFVTKHELLHNILESRYSKDMTLFNVNHMALIHVFGSRMNVMTNILTSSVK